MSNAETQKGPPRIFISYRIADTLPVADRLAADLKRGFGDDQVFFDRRTIEPGEKWPGRIEPAIKGAPVVLVLIGKQWLTEQSKYGKRRLDVPGDWVRREVEAALDNEAHVIPVLVDGASLPPSEAFDDLPSIAALASCQATALRTVEWDNDFGTLVKRLATLVPLLERVPRRRPPKPNNLPYASLGPLFKGREELLAAIRAGFAGEPGHAQVIVARHAIHGLGGIGKTRAAVEYAWRHARDYSALLFVTVQSPADLRTKLAALCDTLGLALGVTEEDERVRATLHWLADPANKGWLLIADNVDTKEAAQAVKQTLSNLSGGHLLVTGRLRQWSADIKARRVDVLDAEAARDFLVERTADERRIADDDPEQALVLAKELGCLALALEQAAAFMGSRALSFTEYRRRWQEADQKVLTWHDPITMEYERPLASTWQASIEELPPPARALLDLLAWLAPEPLPRFLFDHAAAPEGTDQLFADREDPRAILGRVWGAPGADPEEALAALRDLSLLQPSAQTEFATEGQIHRVLALITRERQTAEHRTVALKTALTLVDSAADSDPKDTRTWPIWEPLQPHVRVVADHAESEGIACPTARLLNALGVLLHAKARHAEAEPLYRRALAIDETSLGPEHPDVAGDINNLALLLKDTNRLAEAEPLYRRALVIDEASFGPEDPTVARDINNLALLLKDTNRLAEAEPLMRRGVDIFEVACGAEHPKVATALNNLALLLKATNRLAEAEPLMHRALAIDETSLGPEHPDVARDINNLAGLLKDTDRLAEAELLMHRALAIVEANYGPEHPKVAIRLINLADLHQASNRLVEAEPLMRRALCILLGFTRATAHQHRHLRLCFREYRRLLAAMDLAEGERGRRIDALGAEVGFGEEEFRALLDGL